MSDSESYEWRVSKSGEVNGGHRVYDRGFELRINGQEFNDSDSRAVRDGNRQIVLESAQFNNLQVIRKVFVSPDFLVVLIFSFDHLQFSGNDSAFHYLFFRCYMHGSKYDSKAP